MTFGSVAGESTMKNAQARLWVVLLASVAAAAGCSTAPRTEQARENLIQRAEMTIGRFKQTDPQINKGFFETAEGYAVFPTVAKGGMGVGAAYGRGVLYEGGQVVGYCDLSQASIGFQLGGQTYSEIIFFETTQTLFNFKSGSFEFSAQASAVAAAADASANADYDNGVSVFTLAAKGFMYEASIGGQKFSFQPK